MEGNRTWPEAFLAPFTAKLRRKIQPGLLWVDGNTHLLMLSYFISCFIKSGDPFFPFLSAVESISRLQRRVLFLLIVSKLCFLADQVCTSEVLFGI